MSVTDFLADARPEPKRDRWGRYRIPHPDTGKEMSWTRATTFASSVADTFGLTKWQLRMTARGLALRPDLLAGVAAVADPESSDGKKALDGFCEAAKEHAGASQRATLGTALHSFTEAHDLGREVQIPAPYDADVAAYGAAMRAGGVGIDRAHVERIVCVPQLEVAGTFDRLVTLDGRLLVADLKTGRDLAYAWTEIAIQLHLYSRAATIYDAATGQHEPMPAVDQDRALVMHLPVGEATCTLYEVDIAAAGEMVDVITKVRAWRKRKGLATPLSSAPADTPIAAVVADAPPAVDPPPAAGGTLARTEWMRARIDRLRDSAGFVPLAHQWPDGVPTPKALDGATWTDEDIDTLAPIVAYAEKVAGAPFPDEDPAHPVVVPQREPAPKVETAPLVDLDDGPPASEAAWAALRAEVAKLDADRQTLVRRWSNEAKTQGREWSKPDGTHHERHVAVASAAIDCARHLYDADDPDALTRAALGMVMGEDCQESWRTGAVLGSLTTAQARRLSEISLAFGRSDKAVCAELGARVTAA